MNYLGLAKKLELRFGRKWASECSIFDFGSCEFFGVVRDLLY